ncbi:MAG TPA: hypothetical protein PLP22_10160 [Candidatus Competibacter sp.]|nr:hypothetical protein [Candidatus Competibacteraceae bacterium]HRE55139.1 hypothetical protein [Candidatus Competibacter sp.]HUM95183.1 hypothetical protein [Candidatus Competibacter sp.]
MTPERYLSQYAEPLRRIEKPTPVAWQALVLEPDYYYPPSIELGAHLDGLKRSELLEILQQILATEYPRQRFSKRTARTFLEALQQLRDERAWRRAEMERLTATSAHHQAENDRMTAELSQYRAEVQRLFEELERVRSQAAVLGSEAATLRANLTELYGSSSWKVTKPLRWFGRLGRAARAG